MPWFKVDDALYGHPKWLRTPPAARALWVTAGSWSAAQLTDGHVPAHVLPMLGGTTRAAGELVKAGLWTVDGDGWRFHAWLEFQPSSEQVQAERAQARERQRKAREKAKASRQSHGVTHDEVTDVVTVPPTQPFPARVTPPYPPKRRARSNRDKPEPINTSSLLPPVSQVFAGQPQFQPNPPWSETA